VVNRGNWAAAASIDPPNISTDNKTHLLKGVIADSPGGAVRVLGVNRQMARAISCRMAFLPTAWRTQAPFVSHRLQQF
jgi:hypothetical protein